MLDKRTEMMLQVASTLTAADLDYIRVMPPGGESQGCRKRQTSSEIATEQAAAILTAEAPADAELEPGPAATPKVKTPPAPSSPTVTTAPPASSDPARGARERQRTRESKVSTACVGQPRTSHAWWPLDTELEGRIGSEIFTATVVENSQVKSNRSVLITSGAAQGRVCITPTRAAIEATEEYRRTANLGRGGGVTNGWSFWKPKQ